MSDASLQQSNQMGCAIRHCDPNDKLTEPIGNDMGGEEEGNGRPKAVSHATLAGAVSLL